MRQPKVSVCILQAENVKFVLHSEYTIKGMTVSGEQSARCIDGCIEWNGNLYQQLICVPVNKTDATFQLQDVRIGINVHWERTETQTFQGELLLMPNDGKLLAVNILPVEDYLVSVISSEMKATASLDFLKAHAVISRSWLMAQMENRKKNKNDDGKNRFFAFRKSDDILIRWYDRDDHTLFDVCADDHCQRYQGMHRVTNEVVTQAVRQTRGQVLTYNGKLCDARFSKCCGGMMERFSACWSDVDMPYLQAIPDTESSDGTGNIDLSDETQADKWIRNTPKAFCNTEDSRIISLVLNTYDQETIDFYRWTECLSQGKISELLSAKTKMNFGQILDLIPVKRGNSGRIIMLKIVGTKRTFTIGKELEIRRILSDTHLKSSAFVVEKKFSDESNVPSKFILKGAGWGHGVGLCQIGAAVMGEKGYKYTDILNHYYPDTRISELY